MLLLGGAVVAQARRLQTTGLGIAAAWHQDPRYHSDEEYDIA